MQKNRFFLIGLLLISFTSGCSNSRAISSNSTTSASISFPSEQESSLPIFNSLPSETSENSNSKPSSLDVLTTEKYEYYRQKGYEKLYEDSNFTKGFILSKTSTKAEGGMYHDQYLKPFAEYEDEVPSWIIAQWGSKFDMYKAMEVKNSDNGYVFSYTSRGGKTLEDGRKIPAKKLEFHAKTGSIYLECNAETEYDAPRNPGEEWPSLLMGQHLDHHLIHLSSCTSIIMESQYEITKFEDKMNGNCVESRHAAQAVWYITLQNRNRQSSEYGKYIWMGIRLWDNRDSGKETSLFSAIDGGTSSLMYNTSSKDYLKSNDGKLPNVHQKVTASIDIIENTKKAYSAAVERGYFVKTQYEDLYIGGTNFGLEIPGTYNLGILLDDINVYYQHL